MGQGRVRLGAEHDEGSEDEGEKEKEERDGVQATRLGEQPRAQRKESAMRSEQQQRKRELQEDPDFEHVKKRRKTLVGRKLESGRQKEASASR